MKQVFIVIFGLALAFIGLPIYFYMLYKILQAIDASELLWFLYWVYLPISLFGHIAAKLAAPGKE